MPLKSPHPMFLFRLPCAASCIHACVQGPAATHLHLLEALLQRCVAQAALHRLPRFFANGILALAEHATLHQPQPAGAPTAADVSALTTAGEPRLTFCPAADKGERRAAAAAAPLDESAQHATVAVRRPSPACVVRLSSLGFQLNCMCCAWCCSRFMHVGHHAAPGCTRTVCMKGHSRDIGLSEFVSDRFTTEWKGGWRCSR